jgi:hypothetical protein
MDTKILTLPNGMLINGARIREAEIVRIGGSQDDMLRDKNNLKENNLLEKLTKSAICRLGDATTPEEISNYYDKYLKLPDLTYLLVQIRMFGIRKRYEFSINCPRCNFLNRASIDLSQLKTDEQPEADADLDYYVKEVYDELTERTHVIEFVPLFARQMRLLEAIKLESPKDQATRQLMLQIKKIDGAVPLFHAVKALPWSTRNLFRETMDSVAGGVDTSLVISCRKCDTEFQDQLPVEVRDFFYPGKPTTTPSLTTPYRTYGQILPSSLDDGTGSPAK